MTIQSYLTEQELLNYLNTGTSPGNEVVIDAISAASRKVDSYCNRFFYQSTETMYFSGRFDSIASYWSLEIDDLANNTALVVKTDIDQDGSYARTLTEGTDFFLEPINQESGGIRGWPYTQLRARENLTFPLRYFPWQPHTVQITGTFGWAEVPEPVRQATKIVAAQFYKLAEAPLGVAGWGAFGDIRVKDVPQAASLLAPYRHGQSFGIA